MGMGVLFCLSTSLLAMSVSAVDPLSPQEPPAPKPSAAVQKLLDEAAQPALEAADQALATAREQPEHRTVTNWAAGGIKGLIEGTTVLNDGPFSDAFGACSPALAQIAFRGLDKAPHVVRQLDPLEPGGFIGLIVDLAIFRAPVRGGIR